MALNITDKTFTWPVVLRDNPITIDDKNDRIASLKKSGETQTYMDAAREIVRERTEYRPETIENICKLYEQKKVEMLLNGQAFISDYFHYQPVVQGSFKADGSVMPNSEVRFSINVAATDALRKILDEQVKYEITGLQEQGGAYISRVLNQYTGEDNIFGRNDLAKIIGNKIKSVGVDGSDKGGKLKLVSTLGVETEIEKIGEKTPSVITFNIPQDLAEGEYQVVIETYYAGSNLLKEARTIVGPTITIG